MENRDVIIKNGGLFPMEKLTTLRTEDDGKVNTINTLLMETFLLPMESTSTN